MRFSLILALIVPLVLLSGSASFRAEEAWPEPRPLGKEIPAFKPPTSVSIPPEVQVSEPTGSLTLRKALELALMKNPELRVFSWEVRAAEARTLQAGLIPNPELGYEMENFGGSGDFRSFNLSETTIFLRQLVELGGKRSKRMKVASLERDLTGWDYETKRLEVFTVLTQNFVSVLVAQERLALAEELVKLAEKVHNTASERVKAGKVSPIEETKSGVALASNRIELERIRRSLNASRSRLSAMWGNSQPIFERVAGQLKAANQIPSLEMFADLVSNNPDIARWIVEVAQRQAAVKLEESKRIPDPIIGAGLRWFNETDDRTYVAEISIPLPIFDRNQGGTREAKYRLAQAEEQRKAAEVAVRTALSTNYQSLAAAFVEVNSLNEQVLPGAQSAFDAAVEGYRQGKFGYLEVLDAQRTLFEAKGQYIQALESYHIAVADVERLIGTPLDTVTKRSAE